MEKRNIKITDHARCRLIERVPEVRIRDYKKFVSAARYYGDSVYELKTTNPKLAELIDKNFHYGNSTKIIAYKGCIFVFGGNKGKARTLITVVKLDKNFEDCQPDNLEEHKIGEMVNLDSNEIINSPKEIAVSIDSLITIKECGTEKLEKYVMRSEYEVFIPIMIDDNDYCYVTQKHIDDTAFDDYEPLNVNAMLGKKLLGKSVGYIFENKNENLENCKYEIIDIK